MHFADEAQRALCEQTIARFYGGLDTGDVDAVIACVGAASTWHRKGATLVGPQAIRQALADRAPSRTTCHQMSNLLVTVEIDETLRASYCLNVYDNQGPAGTLQLKVILRSTDRYAVVGQALQLIEKRSVRHLP